MILLLPARAKAIDSSKPSPAINVGDTVQDSQGSLTYKIISNATFSEGNYDFYGKVLINGRGSSKSLVTLTCNNSVNLEINGYSYEYKITGLSPNAFKGDKKLKTFEFSYDTTVTTIPKGAFKNCKQLEYINFKGNSVNKINKTAFKGCTKLKYLSAKKSKVKQYQKMLKKAGAKKIKIYRKYT
ncbi:MAG: leucine-rich repeat domain-containing protein [Butyrivibrio sp.]|nr:leucine-rich repeat domain-containing protein [Butyrivibrio sp.]